MVISQPELGHREQRAAQKWIDIFRKEEGSEENQSCSLCLCNRVPALTEDASEGQIDVRSEAVQPFKSLLQFEAAIQECFLLFLSFQGFLHARIAVLPSLGEQGQSSLLGI